MRAHELASRLHQDSDRYKAVMASVKFDLGEAERVMALCSASTGTFFELPAPICLFEVSLKESGRPDQIQWYVAEDYEDMEGARWDMYFWDSNSTAVYSSPVNAFLYKDGTSHIARLDQQSGGWSGIRLHECSDEEHQVLKCIKNIAQAIEVFSCCNVAQVEHIPDKRRNANRIAKRKVPIFSYRTLHITSDAAPKKGDAISATHASPRLHLRRGHIRRLQDDRRIWVRASLVGDKSKGFAAKDYAV